MDVRYLPEDSVLCPDKDAQLIKGLKGYARVAGIEGRPEYIWQSVKNNSWITTEDLDLVQMLPFKKEEHTGVVYMGTPLSTLSRKFMMLTGFLVRNYLNAKYTTRAALFKDLQESVDIEAKILFVPDWYVSSKKGGANKPLPQWLRDLVMSFLLNAEAGGLDLFLGVYNWEAAREYYGVEIMSLIEDNFIERN